jgi:hypothetical protein
MYTLRFLSLAALPFSLAQETVYGVYVSLHMHSPQT